MTLINDAQPQPRQTPDPGEYVISGPYAPEMRPRPVSLSEEASRLAISSGSNEYVGTPLYYQTAREIGHPELAPLPIEIARLTEIGESHRLWRDKKSREIVESQTNGLTKAGQRFLSLVGVQVPDVLEKVRLGLRFEEGGIGARPLMPPKGETWRFYHDYDTRTDHHEWICEMAPETRPLEPHRVLRYVLEYDSMRMVETRQGLETDIARRMTPQEIVDFLECAELAHAAVMRSYTGEPRHAGSEQS